MTTANSTTVQAGSQYRLPTNAVPSFYDIRIEPDMNNHTFAGEQKVRLEILAPLDKLVLNSVDIKIYEAIICDQHGTRLIGTITHDEKAERATIAFDGIVGTGDWELDLKFSGVLNDKLKGFYRSVYKDQSGKDQTIATTKFEPCDARRAFPCWDEPAFKASFKISLLIDKRYQAISNGSVLNKTELSGDKVLIEFAPSMKMSSYLVAYVIGEFESSKPVYADNKEIRVWAIPGKTHLADLALEAAKFSLEYFARYFQQPYPSEKLDLIAIPDFASGAMENFACVTFRETALLCDRKTASHAEQQRVAEVVMHEIAHMWFGDLVTMSWWNGLWLNEAFATFMAAKALDAWKPEWKFWESFNVERAHAMRVDGLAQTRSIEFAVNNPDEARQMFDVLTYDKGCAILRMLELFLGEEKFRLGIANYLDHHQFGNADTPDLWAAIEEVVPGFSDKVKVTDLMNSWIFQAGYPLISVKESPVTGSVVLSQQIFRYVGGPDAPKTTWHVPIHVRAIVGGNTVEKVVLLSQKDETFYVGENLTCLVVNAGGHGFYRVAYSDELKKKLLDNASTLSASERFNLVSDLWAAVQSGNSSVKDYLTTVSYLTGRGESDLHVFEVIVGSLSWLRSVWSQEEQVAKGLLNLGRSVLCPALKQIGWQAQPQESTQTAQLRGLQLGILGMLGDQLVIDNARKLFAQYKQDRSSVDSNLMGGVVTTLASVGDNATYDEFVALKTSATTPQEEQRFLMALASFRQPELVGRTLTMSVDGTVRTQDAPYLVQKVLGNPSARRQGWQFIKGHWEKMSGDYPASGMTRMCEGITALVEPEVETDVRAWFSEHHVKGGEKAIRQYLEQLTIAANLVKREGPAMRQMLTSYPEHAD